MKTLLNAKMAQRMAILIFASILSACGSNTATPPGSPGGSSNNNANSPTQSCERGVLSGDKCINKSQCSALTDCLNGYSCDTTTSTCQVNTACSGANDSAKCGAGECVQSGGKWVCVNPVTCDPTSTTPWQCAPGFYCTDAATCEPTTTKSACGENGCQNGVCGLNGCIDASFCTSDRDCLADNLCSFSGKCVGRFGDDACGNKCNNSTGKGSGVALEGGVCDRYFGKCVNISDPTCNDLERCQCGDSELNSDDSKCGIADPSGVCLNGYSWDDSKGKCVENPCSTNADCMRDFGGGICSRSTHICEENTPCTYSTDCSAKIADPTAVPVAGSAHRRVCARLPEESDRKCVWEDVAGKEACEDKGYEYEYNETQRKLSCVDPNGCRDTVTCQRSFACDIKKKKCLPVGQFQCDKLNASDDENNPEHLLLNNLTKVNVCAANDYYFSFDGTGVASKDIKITISLIDKSQFGNARPNAPTLMLVDGAGGIDDITPVTDLSGADAGIWSYTYDTKKYDANSIGSKSFKFALNFVDKSISAGFGFYIKVDTIDGNTATLCEDATPIVPKLDGSWSIIADLQAADSSPANNYDLKLACDDTYAADSAESRPSLYSFTLNKERYVKVAVGGVGTDKFKPRLVVRRDCSQKDASNSSCLSASAGSAASFAGILPPGTYTVIVAAANAAAKLPMTYDLRYSEVEVGCTPSDDQCLPNGSLSYCNTAENKLKERGCSDGCDIDKRACREDFGATCKAAREIDFSNRSGSVEEVLNMKNFQDVQKVKQSANFKPNVSGIPAACNATGISNNDNVAGYNAFYNVKVPPKSWLQVEVSKGALTSDLTYSAYLLDSCDISSCQKYAQAPNRGEPTGFVYHNDTNEAQSYIVVIDGNLIDPYFYSNNYANALVKFSSTPDELCDTPNKSRCYLNREVQTCGIDGYWETTMQCSPQVGCDDTASPPACNRLPNQTCADAVDISSGKPLENTFKYAVGGEETFSSDCGSLSTSDRGQVLYYKVKTTGTNKRVRVTVTPKANNAYLKLFRVDGCTGGIDGCADGTSRVQEAKYNLDKESLVLEFKADLADNYYVAVQNKDGNKKIKEGISMGFEIEATVTDECYPYTYAPASTCSGTGATATFDYCSSGGVVTSITCDCQQAGGKFCYDFAKKKTYTYPTSCFSPRLLDGIDGSTGVVGQSYKEGKSYSGTVDRNPTAYTNRFHPEGKKYGKCFFDKETIGYDSIYAIKLTQNQVITAHVKSLYAGETDKNLRLFLLKDCQDLNTCYGLDGISSNRDLTYRATEDGYVFIVVDSTGDTSSNAGDFKLTWSIASGATSCTPDQTYCDETSANTINTCNSDGTNVASKQTCPSNTSCMSGPDKCGDTGSADCGSPINLMSSTFPQKLYFDPSSSSVTSPPCFDGNTASKGKVMVAKIHANKNDILSVKGYALSSKIHAAMWLIPASSSCDAAATCTAASHPAKVLPTSTGLAPTASLGYKFSAADDYKLILTSLEENTENSPLYYDIDLFPSSDSKACDPAADAFKCQDTTQGTTTTGSIYECIDYVWEEIRSCGDGVQCYAGKVQCGGDKEGDYIYNPITINSGTKYSATSASGNRTVNLEPVDDRVRQSCVWNIGGSSFNGPDNFYKIHLHEGDYLTVDVNHTKGWSGEAVGIYTLDANHQLVCLANDPNDSYSTPKKAVDFVAPKTGDYYVVVMFGGKSSSTPPTFDLTATVVPKTSIATCEPYTSVCVSDTELQVCGSNQVLSKTTCPYGCYAANCVQQATSPLATVCDASTPAVTSSFVATDGIGSTLEDGTTSTTFPSQLLSTNLTASTCSGLSGSEEVYTNDVGYKVSLQKGQVVTVYAKYSNYYANPGAFLVDCNEGKKASYAPDTTSCHAGLGASSTYAFRKVLEYRATAPETYYLGFGQKGSGYERSGTLYFVDISTPCDANTYTTTCNGLDGNLLYCNNGAVAPYECHDASGATEACVVSINACRNPTGRIKEDAITVDPSASPGTSITATLPSAGNNYDADGVMCDTASGTAMEGSELFYKVGIDANKTLTVTAKDPSGANPVGLYITTNPDDLTNTCKAFATNDTDATQPASVSYTVTAAETVYVIVDSKDSTMNGQQVDLVFTTS